MKKFIVLIMLLFSQCIDAGVPTSGRRIWDIVPDVQQDLLTIESKVCAFEDESMLDLSGVFTALNELEQNVCALDSQVDGLEQTISMIDGNVDVTLSKVCEIESDVSVIDAELEALDFSGMFTVLDQLNATLCDSFFTFESEIEVVDSKVDYLIEVDLEEFIGTLTALQELGQDVAATVTLINEITASLVDDLEEIGSLIDNTAQCIMTTDSKIDVLGTTFEAGFAGTFTALQASQDKAESIESVIDTLQTDVTIDLNGTYTALQAIDDKLEIIQSGLDDVEMNVLETISVLDIVDSKLDQSLQEACTTESVLEIASSTLDGVDSVLDVLVDETATIASRLDAVEPIARSTLEKLCTIESSVEAVTSDIEQTITTLDSLTDVVLTIESKVDAIVVGDALSKVCELDSLIDVTQEGASSLLDDVIVLESETDVLQSIAEQLASKADIAQSAICVTDEKVKTVDLLVDELAYNVSIIDQSIEMILGALSSTDVCATQVLSHIEVVDSKLLNIDGTVISLDSKLDIIDSLTDELSVQIPIIDAGLTSVQEKIASVSDDFVSTWTILDATLLALCTVESKFEAVSLPDTLAVDLTGIFTLIDTLQEKACGIESKMESVINTATSIMPIDISGTYTMFDAIDSKLDEIESEVDEVDVTDIADGLGTQIRQGDVGTTGYTISTAGKYYLAEDITFSSGAAATAISITADNVLLDLNDYTLSQGNATAGVIGISVSASTNDVQIINGAVDNFRDGIDVGASCTNIIMREVVVKRTATGQSIAFGTGCSAILLDRLDVSSTGGSVTGLEIAGTTAAPSLNVTIMNSVFHDNGADGMLTGTVNRMIVQQSMFFSNGGDGMSVAETSDSVIQGCTSISNTGIGIDLEDGVRNSIRNCTIRMNSSHGIRYMDQANSEIVDNIISLNSGNGIQMAGASVSCYIGQNTLVQNTINYNELGTVGLNSVLGNYAFNATGTTASNYTMNSTILYSVTVSQTTGMPATAPSFWQNISMVP